MNTHLFITDDESWELCSENSLDISWSCSGMTRISDRAFVYVTGGTGIVCEWEVTSPPIVSEEWGFVCDVQLVRQMVPPITIQEIRQMIPRDQWPAPYTNFRGMRAIQIPDMAVRVLHALRPTR